MNQDGYIIYTDGACDPNPGKGGWAAVIIHQGNRRAISGSENPTTNNRMELTAAIMALKSVPPGSTISIHSDSEYVKKGITEWIKTWKSKGWKRKGGVLANVELWQELDKLNQMHKVEWNWVKGHAGNPMNELTDQLARKAGLSG